MIKILFSMAALVMFPVSGHAGETIDLQWSVCDSSPEAVLEKISQSDADEKDGRITYFDSSRPSYLQDGVTFRVKGEKGKEESSVKIRFLKQKEVKGAACEWDRYGSEDKYSCEIVGQPESASSIWSKDQMAFLGSYYRDSDLGKLVSFGPYDTRKWKFKRNDAKVSFDTVDTKEAGHLMEFSLKVPYSDADSSAKDFTNWLQKKGVALCEHQESKTARLFRAMGVLSH